VAQKLPYAVTMKRHNMGFHFLSIIVVLCSLPGCAAVGMSLLGTGAGVATSTSVSYTLDGFAYRTFTVPLPQVERAARTALDKMGLKVEASARTEQGKAILAKGNDRDIEIEFEAVSSKTTRIRTVAKQGIFFKDRATATEIIMQTEKALGLSYS
jgi:cytidylate kinase